MIGLALSGGGTKGSYHVGVYYALKKCHIKVDAIAGTSIGSFNGAMLCAHREKELLNFWKQNEIGKILGFDEKYIKKVNSKIIDKELFALSFENLIDIIENKGIDTTGLKEVLERFDLEKYVRKSNIKFGLSTFKVKGFEKKSLFIEDIPKNKLNDYILASCYLPVFKQEKLDDDSYFIDGGIYNNCPYNMLLEKGCNKVYAVDLKAIGFNEKILDESKVVFITPSKDTGKILDIDQEKIESNIQMGYYDTLKILKNLDGENYIFKKRSNFFYKRLIKKASYQTIEILKVILNENDPKKIVIKALENIMNDNNETYFNIYDVKKLIKKYKGIADTGTIATFIKQIS